jgi:hypothetical protein
MSRSETNAFAHPHGQWNWLARIPEQTDIQATRGSYRDYVQSQFLFLNRESQPFFEDSLKRDDLAADFGIA